MKLATAKLLEDVCGDVRRISEIGEDGGVIFTYAIETEGISQLEFLSETMSNLIDFKINSWIERWNKDCVVDKDELLNNRWLYESVSLDDIKSDISKLKVESSITEKKYFDGNGITHTESVQTYIYY